MSGSTSPTDSALVELDRALTNLEIAEKGHKNRTGDDYLRGIEGARRHIRTAARTLTEKTDG